MTAGADSLRPDPAMPGLAVLDLSGSVAGQFCARLFADNGASVVLAGQPASTPHVAGHGPQSYLFHHLNTGKRVLRLADGAADLAGLADGAADLADRSADLPDPADGAADLADLADGAAGLADLAAEADVIVLDERTDAAELSRQAARGRPGHGHPGRGLPGRGHPVICQLTPFGAGDDWAGLPAGELIYQAISGTMYENGRPDRPPLYGVGHRASYAAGVVGYLQSVAVLLSGSTAGHVVDVSIAEVAASLAFNRITQYSYNRSVLGRDAKETQRTIVRTADGWLGAFVDDRRWAATCRSLGLDDLISDPRWATLAARADNWQAFERELESRTVSRRTDELVEAGQRAKAVISRSVRLTELWDSPQLRARHWWPEQAEPGPDEAEPPRLGPMFRFSRTPQHYRYGPAIRPAGPASELLAEWRRLHASYPPPAPPASYPPSAPPASYLPPAPSAGPVPTPSDGPPPAPPAGPPSDRPLDRPSADRPLDPSDRPLDRPPAPSAGPPPDRPLDGVRIVDLTSAWAGPMATRVLAALGADVIKIEGPGRLDDWRGAAAGGPPDRYPDFDPGDRPYDRHFQFNTQNHDKRSLVLDLKNDASQAVTKRLIAGADVVIANFSVGTLDRMGLGWAEVRQHTPTAILVEMPAYGEGGPISKYVAYGPSMELMCGMAGLVGYGDGKPVTTGPAYLDPMGGLHGAAAVLTALFARGQREAGQRVEVAQTEAAMHWIGELIMSATATGQDPRPDGNRITGAAPHDAYPCAGHDEWIAIAAYDDDQFRRICAALRLGDLPADPRFASLAARRANAAELDALIAARTAEWGKHVLAARLRAAGVAASAVLTARDLHESAFLQRRGLVTEVDHPAVGRHRQQGLPLHISGFDLTIRRPAPRFGEHNDEILLGLGLTPGEIAALRDQRVVTDAPVTAAGSPSTSPTPSPAPSPALSPHPSPGGPGS